MHKCPTVFKHIFLYAHCHQICDAFSKSRYVGFLSYFTDLPYSELINGLNIKELLIDLKDTSIRGLTLPTNINVPKAVAEFKNVSSVSEVDS